MSPESPRLMPTTPRLHRLAYYMIGLSIGLMMVGLIVSLRSQYMHQGEGVPQATDAPQDAASAPGGAGSTPASGGPHGGTP